LVFFPQSEIFFLAPVRFIFSGKTVDLERDGSISKVSSFFVYQVSVPEPTYSKVSKQNHNLKSTGWGYIDVAFTVIVQLALLIPCAIIGSIFKGLSYFNSGVRKAHNAIKSKLTEKNKAIGSPEEPIDNNELLEQQLKEYLQTGQKTNGLVIHAQDKTLTTTCLRVIKNINPLKLILVGDWKKEEKLDIKSVITSRQNKDKWKNWDISALESPRQSINQQDCSVDVAQNAPLSSFFKPKHMVYVVSDQKIANQGEYKLQ